jgi:hypothetical protein
MTHVLEELINILGVLLKGLVRMVRKHDNEVEINLAE